MCVYIYGTSPGTPPGHTASRTSSSATRDYDFGSTLEPDSQP